jgi:hypothetical protein
VTADHGVQLALSCQAGQVPAVLGQHTCRTQKRQVTLLGRWPDKSVPDH